MESEKEENKKRASGWDALFLFQKGEESRLSTEERNKFFFILCMYHTLIL